MEFGTYHGLLNNEIMRNIIPTFLPALVLISRKIYCFIFLHQSYRSRLNQVMLYFHLFLQPNKKVDANLSIWSVTCCTVVSETQLPSNVFAYVINVYDYKYCLLMEIWYINCTDYLIRQYFYSLMYEPHIRS